MDKNTFNIYHTLIEQTGLGYVIIDTRGRVLDANLTYAGLAGYPTVGEILGRSVLEWTAEEDKERNAREVEACGASGSVRDLRIRYRHPDGRTVWVELDAGILTTGGETRILTLCRDITAVVEAEKTAVDRERLLVDVFNSIQDGVSVLDRDLNIIRVNPAMERWYRMNMPLVGKKCFEAYHDKSERCGDCPTLRAFESGRTEYTLVKGLEGSETLWVGVFSYPMRTEPTGAVTGVVEFVRNITKEKIAEEQLLSSETKYRELSELLPQTLFETDLTGRFTYANTAGFRTFGYTAADIASGLTIFDVVIPEERPFAMQRMAANFSGQGSQSQDFTGLRKDGTTFPITVFASPVVRNGAPTGLRGIVADMTEKTRMERERLELTERLRQAEKLQAIGQLAGGVAHDFNNQLTGILSCADLLRTQLEGEGRTDLLSKMDIILRSGERAATLTGQLLAFARKGNFVSVPVGLSSLVDEVIGLLSHSIDKRIAISKEPGGEDLLVNADPGLLQNAILNVALNAKDAMPTGGELGFRVFLADLGPQDCAESLFGILPGRYCGLSVRDSGHGMDRETVKHIFEPFFTTRKERGGTGMGLASVYGTMKTLRGSVQVESRPGLGTVFTLYIPYDPEIRFEGAAAASGPKPAVSKGTVLLADDEETVRQSMSAMLEKLGYTVTACGNGSEAIREFRKNPGRYLFVLLDLVMPVLDGESAFRQVRQTDPGARILLMSGYPVNTEIRKLLSDGKAGFLKKPFLLADLNSAIASIL